MNPLPRWIAPLPASAAPAGEAADTFADVAFSAGAAVASLDQVIRSEPPWLGSWRMRLVLTAAVATARLLRLSADEHALRDARHLTRAGDDPGPAGRLHELLRQWASRPRHLAQETLRLIADEAGEVKGAQEVAALLQADLALAERLGWDRALPLHLAAIHYPALKRGAEGKRPRADEPAWETLRHSVLLQGAVLAHADAVTVSRRAEGLAAAAARLRTRDGGRGLALILADDSVAPWRMATPGSVAMGMSSDRAARRLCETLHMLGVLRLLTERPTFRLYGL